MKGKSVWIFLFFFKLPLEYSPGKMSSPSHEDDPHSILVYRLQSGCYIFLSVWLQLNRNTEVKLNCSKIKKTSLQHSRCFTCLALPCRMQRCTDRYCPAEFWNSTLLEGRPVIKLLSVSLLLLPASLLSLAESSRLASDSEPEILDTSPTMINIKITLSQWMASWLCRDR